MKKIVMIIAAMVMMLSCSKSDKFNVREYTYEFTGEASSFIMPELPGGKNGFASIGGVFSEFTEFTETENGIMYTYDWCSVESYLSDTKHVTQAVVRLAKNETGSTREIDVEQDFGLDVVRVHIIQRSL